MQIRRGYKVRLKLSDSAQAQARLFSGHRRWVWNYFLDLNLRRLTNHQPLMWYGEMNWWLNHLLKKSDKYSWLNEAPAACLQQGLRDLERAFHDAFDPTQPNKRLPTPKKKHRSRTFRYPQILTGPNKAPNLKIDNRRIYLPKLGWVGFFKSQAILGDIKNVTISYCAGHWFASIQTEYEVVAPIHPSRTASGFDRGVVHAIVGSDGSKVPAIRPLRDAEARLAELQRKAAGQVKFSNNWRKTQHAIRCLHHTIANIRHDALHKASTQHCKNHALIYLEALQVDNMTASPAPKPDPEGDGYLPNGKAAKSGLNKAILDTGWGLYQRMCEYKQQWLGGLVMTVPAAGTSQTCPMPDCRHTDPSNRPTRARFHCQRCGWQGGADYAAGWEVRTRGQEGRFAGEPSHDALHQYSRLIRGIVCESVPVQGLRKQKPVGNREVLPPGQLALS